MKPVGVLYRITKELHSLLSEPVGQEKRDELIESITKFLDEREQLMSDIKPPYKEEERKLGAEIVQMNVFIDERLESLKKEIQQDITNQKMRKTSTTKYINPYQSAPADGMFFDKRK
ncbi:flagellar protein FliT [Bacillus timonensis]|uniref:Flagellar protein FliT n=1 Tax=Bacillus timonensis TaxID=1033734 RepID=A0A4S3PSQ8_9BACI|nr:flagellar protein FliT [Bacillus timonensis]THE12355.1 flagellar protein FliT [Bacillus timonensis]